MLEVHGLLVPSTVRKVWAVWGNVCADGNRIYLGTHWQCMLEVHGLLLLLAVRSVEVWE